MSSLHSFVACCCKTKTKIPYPFLPSKFEYTGRECLFNMFFCSGLSICLAICSVLLFHSPLLFLWTDTVMQFTLLLNLRVIFLLLNVVFHHFCSVLSGRILIASELNGTLARGKAVKIWWHIMNWHVICNCVFYPGLYLREMFPPGSAREMVTASLLRKAIHRKVSVRRI